MKEQPKVYVARAGRNGEDEEYALENGLAIIGYREIPSAAAKDCQCLWDSSDLVQAVYRNYERLPAEIQAEFPLKREWMLVAEEPEE